MTNVYSTISIGRSDSNIRRGPALPMLSCQILISSGGASSSFFLAPLFKHHLGEKAFCLNQNTVSRMCLVHVTYLECLLMGCDVHVMHNVMPTGVVQT